MSVSLSPVGGAAGQFFDSNGNPLAGGKLYTYAAGTTTPQATYTSYTGVTANPNPIILNSGGRVPSEIWLTDGVSYKFSLFSALDNLIGTWDNIDGINDVDASNIVFIGFKGQSGFVEDLADNDGSDWIGFQPAAAGIARSAQDKMRDMVSVKDFGAVGNGVTNDAAAIQAAINSSPGDLYIPDGVYIINADLILPDNVCIYFSGDAVFKASANGRTFFKATTHAYFSQIHNAQLDGNGKTGVTGFDMTNFRLNAGIFNVYMTLMENGFIGRQGCFGLKILNPTAYGVKFPIIFITNNSVVEVDNPVFDNSVVAGGLGDGTGVTIQFGSGSNLGARVVGGYIQGFTLGVDDAGIGTVVEGTYFEACTDVDIVAGTNARNAKYINCEHWGSVGNACYRFRNTDAMFVGFPTMGSGARTQVFDVDGTNTNCKALVLPSNASYNAPIGNISGILVSAYTQDYTVTDASGAGLTFVQNKQAYWTVSNNTATISFDITYPSTSNTSITQIRLPINARSNTTVYSGCGFTDYGTPVYLSGITSSVSVASLATNGGLTNADMSGKRVAFTFTYIVA